MLSYTGMKTALFLELDSFSILIRYKQTVYLYNINKLYTYKI